MQKIVVGVDGSDESWDAFDAALDLASKVEATLTVVRAEHLSTWASLGIGTTLGDVYEQDERIRGELIEEAHRRSETLGLTIEVVTPKGRPAEELISVAESTGADVVVVGHRGRGGATSWLGSVTQEVVHRAPCSVLVIR